MEGVEGLLAKLRKDGLLVQGAGAPIWWSEHPSGGWSIHLVAFLTVSSKSVLYGPPETQFEYSCKDCGLAAFNSERGHERKTQRKNTIGTDSHNVISSFWVCMYPNKFIHDLHIYIYMFLVGKTNKDLFKILFSMSY